MSLWWYVSTERWTCAVRTDEWKPFTIRETPPYLRPFRGQPLRNLARWARSNGWQMIRL